MNKNKNNNKFIVVEGLEGAGKKNACLYIKQILKMNGIKKIISIREPGSTLIAEKIRILIKEKYKKEKINIITELLLLYAARTQLVETIIKPALKKGMWVISDRHDLSSFAYQGGGNGVKNEIIITLRKICLNNFYPNLTVYLDVEPEIGLNRAYKRGEIDRIEEKNINFFINTRNRYLKIISKDPNSITINANYNIKIVKENILKKIKHWLKKQI